MTPRADIVVPTYARPDDLRRALGALSRCDGIETAHLVVVDDGSPDAGATAAVIEHATTPVVHLRQENAGPAAARNRGAAAGSAPVVLFLDDDCVPDRRWLTDYLAAFADRPDTDALGGRIVPRVATPVTRFVQAEGLVAHGGSGNEVRFLVSANLGVRREAWNAVGGFDETFPLAAAEDVDFSMRLLASGHSLGLLEGATVAHDHPQRWREVLATYQRHGRGRVHLAAAHPEALTAVDVGRAASVTYWRDRYARYRRDAGPARAVAYSAGRVMGLAGMATAARRERTRVSRRPAPR
jgi:GT2 family glycosyltransferase